MIIETHDITKQQIVLHLIDRVDLEGRKYCSIMLEFPDGGKLVWRPYRSKASCRAAARKLAAKPFQCYGTIAEQLGGATIIDELGD